MRRLGAWWVRLAMAGSCLAWAGCGGGGVPDPDSDSSAATEQASKVVDRGAEGPAAPAAPEPPAQPEVAAPAVASNPTPAGGDKPAPAGDPPAEVGDKAAPGAKGDASGTEDLLRLAGTPAAPASESAPPGTAPAGTAPAPGSPPSVSAVPTTPGPAAPPGGANPAEASGKPGGGAMAGAGLANEEGPGGAGGGMVAPGGGGADLGGVANAGNAAFNNPITAVNSFLAALKAKDKDRLSQATARRSATEAVEKHQKIFAAIIEQSISDEELDDMAKALEGYQVMGPLPAKSTGRIGVVVAKQSGRDVLRRTLMVRKEKEGWKVMDIENIYDFKSPSYRNTRGARR